MTDSELPSVRPQSLSYLNSWLVVGLVFVSYVVCVFSVCVFVCLCVWVSMYVCDCVLVCLCLCEMPEAYKNMRKTTQPFMPAPSTWRLKICHIRTAGSTNNGGHYRVVWLSPFPPFVSLVSIFQTPSSKLWISINKAKAISAELLELNLKVKLYNPVIFMTFHSSCFQPFPVISSHFQPFTIFYLFF